MNKTEGFTREQENLAKEIESYASVFTSAWDRFLEDLRRGKTVPTNEAELRSYLFSHCLSFLRRRKFTTPYEIGVEDKEVYGSERADLTLGFLGEQRCVTVEMKYLPDPESILSDIRKLQKHIEQSKFSVGYFVMIGSKNSPYKEKVDLAQFGFKEEHYEWKEVDSSFASREFQTSIVYVRALE